MLEIVNSEDLKVDMAAMSTGFVKQDGKDRYKISIMTYLMCHAAEDIPDVEAVLNIICAETP